MKKPGNAEMLEQVVAAAMTPGPRTKHSPVYQWLWANYDGLLPAMSPPRTPNWPEVAAALARLGVLDGAGKQPTASATRNTWWRVTRDKTAGPKQRKPGGRKRAQPVEQQAEPLEPTTVRPPGKPHRQQFSPGGVQLPEHLKPKNK